MEMSFRNIPAGELVKIQFPGCCVLVHNILDSDDGIVGVSLIVEDPKVEVTTHKGNVPWAITQHLLTAYGPHEGEPGHYKQDGTKEE